MRKLLNKISDSLKHHGLATDFCILVLGLLFYSATPVSATIPFRQQGILLPYQTVPAKAVSNKERYKSQNQFFGTTQPLRSNKNAVKTYVLTVIRRLKSSDWSSLSQSNITKFSLNRHCLLKPVSGYITSPFGMRIHPITGRRKFHAGIDIGARIGTPIHAALGGKVIFAGWKHGYGLMLILDHGNGMNTVYAHCSRLLVKMNQVVTKGYRIAKVGRTGVTTGPHLHFEVRINGKVRNPRRYLAR